MKRLPLSSWLTLAAAVLAAIAAATSAYEAHRQEAATFESILYEKQADQFGNLMLSASREMREQGQRVDDLVAAVKAKDASKAERLVRDNDQKALDYDMAATQFKAMAPRPIRDQVSTLIESEFFASDVFKMYRETCLDPLVGADIIENCLIDRVYYRDLIDQY